MNEHETGKGTKERDKEMEMNRNMKIVYLSSSVSVDVAGMNCAISSWYPTVTNSSPISSPMMSPTSITGRAKNGTSEHSVSMQMTV